MISTSGHHNLLWERLSPGKAGLHGLTTGAIQSMMAFNLCRIEPDRFGLILTTAPRSLPLRQRPALC